MDERFDDVLLNIAGSLGGIEPLFDTIFSFLLRKTDYFRVMQPGDKMETGGRRAAIAASLVCQVRAGGVARCEACRGGREEEG